MEEEADDRTEDSVILNDGQPRIGEMTSRVAIAAGTIFTGGAATAAAPHFWITTLGATIAVLVAFFVIWQKS